MRRAGILASAILLLTASIAWSQEKKNPDSVKEVQAGLLSLGYLQQIPDNTDWSEPFQETVAAFLGDLNIDVRAATSDNDLFLLRAAIRDELARSKADSLHLFVPTDNKSVFQNRTFISTDGSIGLMSVQDGIRLWDFANGKQIATYRRDCCSTAAVLSDDGRLAAYSATGIGTRVRDTMTGMVVSHLKPISYPGDILSRSPSVMKFLPSKTGLLIGDEKGGLSRLDFDGNKLSLLGEHLAGVRDASIYGATMAMDVSADGRLAATLNGYDGNLKIWDIEQRKVLRTIPLYRGYHDLKTKNELDYQPLLAFSKSGRNLVLVPLGNSGKYSRRLVRIDVASGAVSTINVKGEITSRAASPTNDVIALSMDYSRGGPNYTSIKAADWLPVVGGGPWPSTSAPLDPAETNTIEVYDLESLALLGRVPSVDLVWAVANYGKVAVVGQREKRYESNPTTTSGRGDGNLAFANLLTGAVTPVKEAKQLPLSDFAFDERRDRIQIGLYDDKFLSIGLSTGAIESISVTLPPRPSSDDDKKPIRSDGLVLTPRGTLVDAAGARIDKAKGNPGNNAEAPIIVIDPNAATVALRPVVPTAKLQSGFDDVRSVVTPDGAFSLVTFERDKNKTIADAFVSVVDTATGREARRISLAPLTNDALGLLTKCAPPNCKRNLSGTLIESFTKKHAPLAVSGTGKTLYAGFWEPAFAAYDIATGRRLRTFDTSLDFSKFAPTMRVGAKLSDTVDWEYAASRRAARTSSIPLAFIPVPGTEEIYVILGAPTPYVGSVNLMLHFPPNATTYDRITPIPALTMKAAASDDGTKMALAYAGGLMLVIDTQSGRVLSELKGHLLSVSRMTFSPDGSRLFSRGDDDTVRMWNVGTGALLTTTYIFANGEWLTITPEGFFAASANGARALLLRRGASTIYSIDQFYQALYRPDLVKEKLAGDPRGLVRGAADQLDLNKAIASGAAPEVSIVSPKSNDAPATASITAEIDLVDRGGGIGRIEWRLNGVTVGIDDRSAIPAAPGSPPARLTRSLLLDEGDNSIEVVAYNGANLVSSTPARTVVVGTAPSQRVAPRLFVLAVGLNDYEEQGIRLKFAVPDAQALTDALVKTGQGVYENVDVTLLRDADARRGRIDAAFTELAEKIRPTDVFVFFVAGHGKTLDGRYYFVPQDFKTGGQPISRDMLIQQGIAQEQWQAWFAKIPAKRSVLLFDTCESASLTGDGADTRVLEQGAANSRLMQATGRTIMTAATGDALEGYRGHGLFTYNIIEALGRADSNGDGKIEVGELATYVYAQVSALSEQVFRQRQVPQISMTGADYTIAMAKQTLENAEPGLVISERPTHLLGKGSDLLVQPGTGARRLRLLEQNMQVTLVSSDSGWTLVALNGKPLGYVATRDLRPVR